MTKKKQNKSSKKPGKKTLKQVRNEIWEAADRIAELTDTFCLTYLNEEYRELCEDMIAELVDMDMPLEKGKPAGWASGIVHAIGFVNFLQDPSQSPHVASVQIAEGFGVSQQTMQTKSKIIRDELDLIQLDPDWCLPSLQQDNPLIWMISVDGFIMDIRQAPREMQEEAYQLGLIHYIPADQPPPFTADSSAKIIQFPSRKNKTSKAQSAEKQRDNGPSLFDGVEQ